MQIGDYKLDNSVALAPMAGVTDLPFRRLVRSLGVGYVVGEMMASDPSLRATTKSKQRGVHLQEPAPRAIQIVGWDPQIMASAARFNVDQGASIIDINMGCPAKKVCKRLAGSALLADPDLVRRILESVVAAVAVPVTLKIRTGVSPTRRNGVEIARIAEQSGVSALAVHGRTRACRYQGSAEYDTIRAIVQAVSIPVFANGDITSVDKARVVQQQTGAEGVMIGRGAHGAPWFPGQVAEYLKTGIKPAGVCFQQQSAIVSRHIEEMYAFYGIQQGVRIARKHIKWYTEKLPEAREFWRGFHGVETPRQQLSLCADYYNYLSDQLSGKLTASETASDTRFAA